MSIFFCFAQPYHLALPWIHTNFKCFQAVQPLLRNLETLRKTGVSPFTSLDQLDYPRCGSENTRLLSVLCIFGSYHPMPIVSSTDPQPFLPRDGSHERDLVGRPSNNSRPGIVIPGFDSRALLLIPIRCQGYCGHSLDLPSKLDLSQCLYCISHVVEINQAVII